MFSIICLNYNYKQIRTSSVKTTAERFIWSSQGWLLMFYYSDRCHSTQLVHENCLILNSSAHVSGHLKWQWPVTIYNTIYSLPKVSLSHITKRHLYQILSMKWICGLHVLWYCFLCSPERCLKPCGAAYPPPPPPVQRNCFKSCPPYFLKQNFICTNIIFHV